MRSVVRMKGLEPPRLSALDPKSSAATNYATSANCGAKIKFFFDRKFNLDDFFLWGMEMIVMVPIYCSFTNNYAML